MLKEYTVTRTGIFALLFIISACNGLPSIRDYPSTPTLSSKQEWIRKWLWSPVCKPPCWENITPGLTAFGDVLSLLKPIDGLKVIGLPQTTSVHTKQYDLQIEKTSGYVLAYSSSMVSQETLVTKVVLIIDEDQLPLCDVISAYGEPDYIYIKVCQGAWGNPLCETSLIFDQSGMALEFIFEDYGHVSAPKIHINAESRVTGLIFFYPGKENYAKVTTGFLDIIEKFISWKGYGEYP